jgi:hypothetical protein
MGINIHIKLTIKEYKENFNMTKIFMGTVMDKKNWQPLIQNISILSIKKFLKINLRVRAVCLMTVSNFMREELSNC